MSSSHTGTTGLCAPAERLQRAVADERADHEDVAVGEVEELEDAVDERVAERDQRVDAPERQSVEGELEEGGHAGSNLDRLGGPVTTRAAQLIRLFPTRRACTSRRTGS